MARPARKQQKDQPHKRSAGRPARRTSAIQKGVYVIVAAALVLAGATIALPQITSGGPLPGPVGSTHIHADFAVFINGQQLTPLPNKYFVKVSEIHIEGGAGAGSVLHMHATNTSLGYFFNSLGWKFNKKCLQLDTGESYCNEGTRTLKMYVMPLGGEWKQNTQFDRYVFRPLDKILITYGAETADALTIQMAAVGDAARLN